MNMRVMRLSLRVIPAFVAVIGVAHAATNGHGVTLSGASTSSPSVQARAQQVSKSGNGVVATFAIDPVGAGIGTNARGQQLVVGPLVVVEAIAAIPAPEPTGPGDVNGDGIVSPQDAQAVFQCYLMGGCATPAKTAAADLCPGGPVAVTPADAQVVFDVFLGLGPNCP